MSMMLKRACPVGGVAHAIAIMYATISGVTFFVALGRGLSINAASKPSSQNRLRTFQIVSFVTPTAADTSTSVKPSSHFNNNRALLISTAL